MHKMTFQNHHKDPPDYICNTSLTCLIMRYGITQKTATRTSRHSKAISNIATKLDLLKKSGYNFKSVEHKATLLNFLDAIVTFDLHGDLQLSQISKSCIRFARETTVHFLHQ